MNYEKFIPQIGAASPAQFGVFEKSINTVGGITVFMAKDGDETVIISTGDVGFTGESLTAEGVSYIKAPLSHDNACVLRKLFPFTAPVRVLGRERSFGVGDRLGIATPGHIRVFEDFDAYPVLAQQSMRELTLTNRTYEDVVDSASFAVYRDGFKKGFGADGDHLKTAKDVEYALSLGFTMITLDCSDHIKNGVTDEMCADFEIPSEFSQRYLGKSFDIGEGVTLTFDEAELKKILIIYGGAIDFAHEIYNTFFASGKYDADFEISIDETATPTTPLQHFFVASELALRGVKCATVAPRFCGEFQKGVDYIGDLAQFEDEMTVHSTIARHFGYKLSIHSGSDKFSTFPIIGEKTRGVFHVKTAGTNWLEAMRVVAIADPSLYRQIHKYALVAFAEASTYYHVTTDLNKIPDIDKMADSELPELFTQNDPRQLIHITYGLILSKKTPEGEFEFRDKLYKLWRENEGLYSDSLYNHIGRHMTELGVARV
ncbi:MAG: hypothetical protein BWY15_00835 [Firmicutes bacterium ADurb.Bin193]|nr:MAG: hypothetical protein BWY15_00835 [Firmicutes bacterium ADurb.Bin193]